MANGKELITTTAEVKDVSGLTVSFVPPQEALQMTELAEILYGSNMFPNVRNKQGAFAVALLGRELGVGTMTALQNIAIIKGKFSCSAQLQQARAMKRGVEIDIKEMTKDGCTLILSKKGRKPQEFTFTIEDAKTAGLVLPKSAWETYPADMCYNRALTRGLRKFDPECILGLFTIEEVTEGLHTSVQEIPDADFEVTTRPLDDAPKVPPPKPDPVKPATALQVDSVRTMVSERELTDKLFNSTKNFLEKVELQTDANVTSLIIKLKELPLKKGVEPTLKYLMGKTKDELLNYIGEQAVRIFSGNVEAEIQYYEAQRSQKLLSAEQLGSNNKGQLANLILIMRKEIELEAA